MTNRTELRIRFVLAAVIGVLVILLFHFMGNTANVKIFGRSTFVWAFIRWRRLGGQFSYAFLVPLVSAWLVWRRRQSITDAVGAPDVRGLVTIVASLLLQIAAYRTQLPRLSMLSFIGLLWGVPWYLFGARVGKQLFFPCAYLIFCIPLTFLDNLTFPLRQLSASLSTLLLNGVGVAAVKSGTAIYLTNYDSFALDVADPCSGLKYLLALAALTAAYSYVVQPGIIRKWILFLCVVPLAIAANSIRIVALAFIAMTAGPAAAQTAYHEYSGYIVFASAVILMTGISTLLKMPLRQRIRACKR